MKERNSDAEKELWIMIDKQKPQSVEDNKRKTLTECQSTIRSVTTSGCCMILFASLVS